MLLTCPTSAADWFTKGRAMCYHVYAIMYVNDPETSVRKVGHRVPFAGFCPSLYNLHVLNSDVNMIQTNRQTNQHTRLETSTTQTAYLVTFVLGYWHLEVTVSPL